MTRRVKWPTSPLGSNGCLFCTPCRREPTCIPADPAPVSAHETGHPAEPHSAARSPPATGPRESSAPTGPQLVHVSVADLSVTFHSPNVYPCSQQISQHQELFIQMLNEPVGEGGEAPEVGELAAAGEEGAPVNYIQVTPQEKEAIERVNIENIYICFLYY